MPSSQDFNEICYLNRYPDLKTAIMYKGTHGWGYGNAANREHKVVKDNLFWHWQNFGMKEGRVCGCDLPGTIYSQNFNAAAYMARYYDIRVGLNEMTGKPSGYNTNPEYHYQTIGIYEGRHPGFEIVTSNSPVGMVSPGTTTTIEDNPALNTTPGDNTVLPALTPDGNPWPTDANGKPWPADANGNPTDPNAGTVVPSTPAPTQTNTWLIVGAIAAVLLLSKKKKKRA